MKVYTFNDYSRTLDIANDFLLHIKENNEINKDSETRTNDEGFLSKLVKDLKLNTAIILSFGTGMELLIPIVKRLCENGDFRIDLTLENLTLMTLTAVTVAYLEEVKDLKTKSRLERDSKSMLEELKLRGIGNGIIKKLVKALMSIGYLSKLVIKHRKNILTSFFEMLGYAALCIPILNGIKALVGDYDMTLDNFGNNIASLLIGLSSLSSKHILNLLKSAAKEEEEDNIEPKTDIIDSGYHSEKEEELIREQ